MDRTACIWLIRRFLDPQATFAFFGDPADAPEGAELFDVVGAFRSSREETYRTIIAEAERLRRKAQMGGKGLSEQLRKIEREFRVERKRDYFRSPLRGEAAAALKTARETVRGSEAPGEVPGAGGEG